MNKFFERVIAGTAIALIVGSVLAVFMAMHAITIQGQNTGKQVGKGESAVVDGDNAVVDHPGDSQPMVADFPPQGYIPDPEGTEKFLQSLDKPLIRDAGADLFRARPPPDKDGVFLYRPFQKAYREKYGKDWACGQQKIGDCVSWGWHHGVAFATSVEWQLGGISEWDLPATEAIYGGSRVEGRGLNGSGVRPVGGWSDGSYGAAAARFVTNYGILFRREYPFSDLRAYSGDRAKQWGAYGCGGQNDNGKADEACREFPVRQVALVRTFDEAKAAILSGYPIPICSQVGFSLPNERLPLNRDKDGFLRPRGTWAHCMCLIAVRFDRDALLCLNSWGTNWVTGPKYPPDQPDGSFWIDRATCDKILSQGDSFAVSAVNGFPYRPISNSDWVHARPVMKAGDSYSLAIAP